jgi:hypothetical protein
MEDYLSLFVTILLGYYLRVCDFGYCKTIEVEPEVIAITSCESGDGLNFGTIKWDAVGIVNPEDTGAFQFNDRTWRGFKTGFPHAKDAPHSLQVYKFYELWNDGLGWTHWKASRKCWGQWISVTKDGRAVWNGGQ